MKKHSGKALAMAVMMSVLASGSAYAQTISETLIIEGGNPITLNPNAGTYPDPSITIGKTDSGNDNVRINNLGLECYHGDLLWAAVNINGLTTINSTNKSEVDETGLRFYKNGDYENPFMKFDVFGVDVGKNVIKNVAAGTNDTDAVNKKQMEEADADTLKKAKDYTDQEIKKVGGGASSEALEKLDSKINQTNDRVDRVGATAAALAGIHYQPMAKGQSQVAIGMGGYKGKKATALGLAYQFNDRVSGSVAGAANGSEHMFNVGFNYLFGQHTAKDVAQCAVTPGSMSLKEAEMQATIDSQNAKINSMEARMAQLEAMVKALAAK